MFLHLQDRLNTRTTTITETGEHHVRPTPMVVLVHANRIHNHLVQAIPAVGITAATLRRRSGTDPAGSTVVAAVDLAAVAVVLVVHMPELPDRVAVDEPEVATNACPDICGRIVIQTLYY